MKKCFKITCLVLFLGFTSLQAQVGVGTNNPHKSSVLDMKDTSDKGLLIPNVKLNSTVDIASIAGGTPAQSLLVYNTNAAITGKNSAGTGFYYWDTNIWKKMTTKSEVSAFGLKVINSDYTVADTDYTIVASGMNGDVKVTLPDAASNKDRILEIKQNEVVNAAGNELTVKFNVPVKYSDKVSKDELLAPYYSAVTGGTLKISLQSDGTNWYVISSL